METANLIEIKTAKDSYNYYFKNVVVKSANGKILDKGMLEGAHQINPLIDYDRSFILIDGREVYFHIYNPIYLEIGL